MASAGRTVAALVLPTLLASASLATGCDDGKGETFDVDLQLAPSLPPRPVEVIQTPHDVYLLDTATGAPVPGFDAPLTTEANTGRLRFAGIPAGVVPSYHVVGSGTANDDTYDTVTMNAPPGSGDAYVRASTVGVVNAAATTGNFTPNPSRAPVEGTVYYTPLGSGTPRMEPVGCAQVFLDGSSSPIDEDSAQRYVSASGLPTSPELLDETLSHGGFYFGNLSPGAHTLRVSLDGGETFVVEQEFRIPRARRFPRPRSPHRLPARLGLPRAHSGRLRRDVEGGWVGVRSGNSPQEAREVAVDTVHELRTASRAAWRSRWPSVACSCRWRRPERAGSGVMGPRPLTPRSRSWDSSDTPSAPGECSEGRGESLPSPGVDSPSRGAAVSTRNPTLTTTAAGEGRGMQDTATHNDFDVIIVGARCAGAATARQLALAGARVLVVDRGTEGSDTLSTSYLMPGAVMQLARWGLLPALEAAGTPRVQKVTYHYFAERDVVLDVRASPPVDALYAPRRTVLDPILVQAAREAGAEFRFSVRLERLVHDATGRVVGVVLREGGRIRRLRCDMVVGADGRRSHVAGLVGAEIYRRSRHGSPGVYAYFEGMPLDGYHWYYGPRVYGGAAPTNDGLATVFVGAPSEDLPELFGGDRGAAFPRLSRLLHPAFHEALESARRVGAPRAFPHVPGHYRHSHGPGWALVGDAGYYRDPNTAHGISDALRDAELLALAIGVGTEDALARFQATRDRATARLFEATDRLASYAWDASGVQGILRDVSAGMKEGISALVDATRRAA